MNIVAALEIGPVLHFKIFTKRANEKKRIILSEQEIQSNVKYWPYSNTKNNPRFCLNYS